MFGCLPQRHQVLSQGPHELSALPHSPSQAHPEKGVLTLAAKLSSCHSSLEVQCHLRGLRGTFQRQLGWYFAHLQSLNPYFTFPMQNILDVNTCMEQQHVVHGWLLFEITLENHCSFWRVTHTCNPSLKDSIGACWDGSSCCVQTSLLLPEKLGQPSFLPDSGNQQSSRGRAVREAQTPRLGQQCQGSSNAAP